jgi:hypothetical protein
MEKAGITVNIAASRMCPVDGLPGMSFTDPVWKESEWDSRQVSVNEMHLD